MLLFICLICNECGWLLATYDYYWKMIGMVTVDVQVEEMNACMTIGHKNQTVDSFRRDRTRFSVRCRPKCRHTIFAKGKLQPTSSWPLPIRFAQGDKLRMSGLLTLNSESHALNSHLDHVSLILLLSTPLQAHTIKDNNPTEHHELDTCIYHHDSN